MSLALLGGLAGLMPAPAVVIGRPKPVCEEVRPLEGVLHLRVADVDGGELRFVPVEGAGSDPVVLSRGRTYRLGLRLGAGDAAPVISARYRLESRSFLTLFSHASGPQPLPLEREFSINTLDEILVYARHPGRRRLYLRVSECYRGGARFLYSPSETLIPLVVVEAGEDAGEVRGH